MRLASLKKALSRDVGEDAEARWPCSVVGCELVVSGCLEALGELRIEGTVRGEVRASRVILCPGGFLDGTLVASEAVLQGWMKGRVFAFRVTADDTAVIQGTVFHHEITMAPGVQLDGRAPWRPVNWFENPSDDFQGEHDEHVRAQ